MARPGTLFTLAACAVGLSLCACGSKERRPDADAPASGDVRDGLLPGAHEAGPSLAPGCRQGFEPTAVSPQGAGATSPSLAWGPGVVALAYIRDEDVRSLLAVERFVGGAQHGPTVNVGEGAAREPTSVTWDGTSFVLAWGEPKDLVPEVFVGMVVAAGSVRWSASRLTETLQTGAWRTPGRTAVESKDPRVLALGNLLLLAWRTRTFPEAHPLYFAAVRGLEVSAPVAITAETDFVLDHRLVDWSGRPAEAYIGRFSKTQRQVRVARLSAEPPSVTDDWLVAELSKIPDAFEIAAVAVDADLVLLWRTRTEWNSTSNVAYARIGPDGPGGPMADTIVVEGALASNPPVNQPRRSFAVAPLPRGFVLAWGFQDKPDAGGGTGLRVARYHADGTLDGAPLAVPTDARIARDPALLRGADGEYWYAFVIGDPPGERGRVYFGSVICGR
jgi:hypothetical protein